MKKYLIKTESDSFFYEIGGTPGAYATSIVKFDNEEFSTLFNILYDTYQDAQKAIDKHIKYYIENSSKLYEAPKNLKLRIFELEIGYSLIELPNA